MSNFRNYSVSELSELTQSEKPATINLILDEQTVDFLLGWRPEDRAVNDDNVDNLAESIEDVVLQTVGTMYVDGEQLIDGLHRLVAIKQLGCPESLVATVVFGAAPNSLEDES